MQVSGFRFRAFRASHYIFFVTAVLFYACTPEYLSEKELKEFILDEKNGLTQKVQHGDYEVTATFRPSDLLVLQEIKSNESLDTAKLTALKKKYNPQYYFVLNMSKNGREAINPAVLGDDFSDVLQNVSFRMGQFVRATTAKQDTIPLKDFFFNRTFGMGAGSEILLVFDKKKTDGSDVVQINLSELGLGIGTQHFKFEKDNLDNIPKIDFRK